MFKDTTAVAVEYYVEFELDLLNYRQPFILLDLPQLDGLELVKALIHNSRK